MKHATSSAEITRRMLVLSALSATVIPTRKVRAEPVSIIAGMTALEIGAAVVGIIAGIVGLVNAANTKRTLAQINRRLEVIIGLQYTIINELREMKLLIVETAFISWRDAYARRLVSYDSQLKILFADYEADGLSKRVKDDFEELSRECTLTTLEIGQMDVWAFTSFASGVATVLLTEKILRASPQRLNEAKAQFVGTLNIWLDPQRPSSLPQIIVKTESEVNTKRAALNGRGRSYVTFDDYEFTEPDCSRKAKVTLTVSGDFEKGFSGSNSYWAEKTWRCKEIPVRYLRNDVPLAAQIARENSSIVTARSGGAAAAPETIAIPVVPGFSPSEYTIVDDFNRERVAIYELMAANAKQRIMQQQMTALKFALA